MDKKELKERKAAAVEQYKCFVKNPELILTHEQCDGELRFTELEKFYKRFAEAYLKPDFEGFSDKVPDIKLKDVNKVPQAINAKHAKGEYNTPNNEVYMYDNPFKKVLEDRAKGEYVSSKHVLSLLTMCTGLACHEYQHAKQQTYVDLLNNGEYEKAKQFGKQLSKNTEGIVDDMGFNGAECISVIEEIRPDLYEELKSKTRSRENTDTPVVDAFYNNRPIEVDARTKSLVVFDKFSKDVFKSGGMKESVKIFKEVANAFIDHRKKLNDEPVAITKEDILNRVKRLTAEDFSKYAERVDEIYSGLKPDRKQELDYSSLTNSAATSKQEFELEKFACVLKEYVDACPPEQANEMLSELQMKCEGFEFGSKIVNGCIDSLNKQEQKTAIEPVTKEDLEKEGYGKQNTEKTTQANNAKTAPSLELTQEENKEIEKQ